MRLYQLAIYKASVNIKPLVEAKAYPTLLYDVPKTQGRGTKALLLFSKLLAQLPLCNILGVLWLQNFKQLFVTHLYTDSLDSSSKYALPIISEVPT